MPVPIPVRSPALLAIGWVLAAAFVSAPVAGAEPTDGPAACRPSVEAGVEVDTCTGTTDYGDNAGQRVRVVPQFCIGLGIGGCDD
ncbi:hypothetical protein [Mycolicibacterium sp. 050158]|jgi:hypothetical protein|uniref:hypothetical protein n=1 Tax=Mycolicibacterium sp. 050158 TaxID=3090602 RepID=UPI00299EDD74|nr:hypothetical protein [Mycolicibacterium sp. 050158]MDX1888966.1 hypothetical protein [Mycolicibacterium sp. 050158]